jgi:hypothetical protein
LKAGPAVILGNSLPKEELSSEPSYGYGGTVTDTGGATTDMYDTADEHSGRGLPLGFIEESPGTGETLLLPGAPLVRISTYCGHIKVGLYKLNAVDSQLESR